jgi:methionyl-tRNA synthetase
MSLARLGNKYFNDSEPWATRKSNPAQCATTIHVSLEVCATLSILFEPFLPFSSARLRQMLKLDGVRSSKPDGPPGPLGWDAAARPLLSDGHALGQAEILFAKLEDDVIEAQNQRLAQAAAPKPAEQPYAALAGNIAFEDFAKLDLRLGVVRDAERVVKSKKLIRCIVDLGFEERQVLAGVAEHLGPDDLKGKTVVVVANLAPRTMLGLESQGMLLMATDREGRLTPILGTSEPGSRIS